MSLWEDESHSSGFELVEELNHRVRALFQLDQLSQWVVVELAETAGDGHDILSPRREDPITCTHIVMVPLGGFTGEVHRR